MEMTTYQAVFAVLLIFFLGDMVGALTKAKVSSMFVIMMGFLVLFMTGIYPANIMEISGFAAVAKLGQYFLLFNMGTSVDIATLKREWRTVVCATVGMAAAVLGCVVAIPFIGKEFALAAAPVVNGGIVATTTMVEACDSLGFETAAALATFVYAVQKFVGTLPASNCGLSVANDLVSDLRAKHAADSSYNWYTAHEGSAAKSDKVPFWTKHKKYYTQFICLAVAAAMLLLSEFLGKVCQGWVNMSIWAMVLGIICRNTGLVPSNMLRDFAKANGFFAFLSLCTIIPSLAKVDWAQLPVIGVKALIIFVLVVVFTYVVFYLTPAWKIVGSKKLSIGIAMCQLIGYPGTELIATEITNAVGQTAEERDAVSAKIQTAYVISGFTSVTILSVFIASFLAKLMGA
ncbi:hypothetical protein [Oscillibacter sp.]|uniref:hypothetical protein n=1 Tax=Oscillibacter sp. TaxID=1945593 RepID=UPI00262A315F|nr:hypothetical protein [Oscillibacter sp.]MDD3347889.1 hypothetical protein [Oscillibacter sp.]